MKRMQALYVTNRDDWRKWLEENFETQDDVWLEYPKKKSGKPRILYNDAVEEALCFGWIDTTVKSLDEETSIQRFCKRRKNSTYSQLNKERLKWLFDNGLIHPSVLPTIEPVLEEKFVFPADIVRRLKKNTAAWRNFQKMSASYQRIRVAYIDTARNRPEEFEKRLNNLIKENTANRQIRGFGGSQKYY